MKNSSKKLVLLTIPFLVAGCNLAGNSTAASSSNQNGNSNSSSSSSSSSSAPHEHVWSNDWESNETNHWHACSGCNEKKDDAAHTFGDAVTANLGTLLKDDRFNLSTIKYQDCSVCGYRKIDANQSMLPEIYFNFESTYTDKNGNVTQQEMDFATKARSTDKTRPTVQGKLQIKNAGTYNTSKDLDAGMKVRGNQTAGFDKKGLQIKLDKKNNLLGLNGGADGKGFKKWVLLADAKDTTLSRTALGLTLSQGVIGENSKVWSTNFTPVKVFLNNQYWGLYMLAEQKEVKAGRIGVPEVPEDSEGNAYTGTDIGYCFELDYYAKDEPGKGADGDPTFTLDYGSDFTSSSFNIESGLANSGLGVVKTYTMNSDITDSTAGANEHTNESKSAQLRWIKARTQALFKVLAEASKRNTAKDINENNEVVSTTLSVKQTIEKNFDLNAWAEGFIINAVCLPPDVGYSSFYMSFDNSTTGDKKLRFDNPWDFDSNFGNRRNFLEKPDQVNTITSQWGGSQSYDPYFMDRTANMWLQLLGKLDFFMNDYVKPKWEAAKANHTFENMVSYAETFYEYFDTEFEKNFQKWPTTQASDNNVGSYFNGDGVNSGELRKPFVNVNERKDAQKETLSWLNKRVAYLDGRWGTKA